MYNALAYNYYYLGEEDESHYYWDKLKQISKVEIGHAPWVIENSKEVLTNIFCHYFKVMTVIIVYMVFFIGSIKWQRNCDDGKYLAGSGKSK